jgi:prolipoprotein diacylglyceryltransferase
MQTFLTITWSASPEIINIGPITLRWYGLLFASGFLVGLFIVKKMFIAEKAPEAWLDKAFMHIVLGAVIGARLGHVFFYDWEFYSNNLMEIPKIWRGGLASHGGAIGIIIALWLFSKNVSKKSILWILDKVVVPTALAGCFIRLGNLMNSEIIGSPSDASWALTYLVSFALLFGLYWKTNAKDKPGFFFGLFLVLIFGFRILMENFKESQGGFESALGNIMSTGQWLSIPFVLIGLFFILRPTKHKIVFR